MGKRLFEQPEILRHLSFACGISSPDDFVLIRLDQESVLHKANDLIKNRLGYRSEARVDWWNFRIFQSLS